MITLAEIERAVRARRDFSVIELAYLHRATTENALGIVKTRDRIRAAAMAAAADEAAGPVHILHDLGDMIAFETAQGWRGHRWAVREGDRILSETLVIDGAARATALGQAIAGEAQRRGAAHPVHVPFGELRAGRGQCATSDTPDLPADFPDTARSAATRLHRLWNAGALDLARPAWSGPDGATDEASFALGLIRDLPDATLTIERGIVGEDKVALLWRLHGHPASAAPRRIRVIGSSVTTLAGGFVVAEDMLIDTLAMAAQHHRPIIDYAA